MADSTDIWTIAASGAAVASAVGAWLVYRGQTRQAHFELARSLHLDLTTGSVAEARNQLTVFRLGSGPYDATVLSAYFTLLWCFERVLRGRQSMTRSRVPTLRRSPAVRFLDEALAWHVEGWEQSLPAIRTLLRAYVPNLDDAESYRSFEDLAAALHAARVVPRAQPALLPSTAS